MSLQEMPEEVVEKQSFWLHEEKVLAWLIITTLVLLTLGSAFRAIGRITWPAIFILAPFIAMLCSKEILKKVDVTKESVTVRKFKKIHATFTDYTVGVFERRTGRRVLPYMYVRKNGFEVSDDFLAKCKKCSDDFIFFSLSPNVGMKVIAFLPTDLALEGENGNLNEKNAKILAQAKKNADILRKSMRA